MNCRLNWLKKLDSLKELLQLLESRIPDGRGPSAPAPIMQTTNQPSPAARTGGSSAPTALLLSCPPLPQAFKTVCKKANTKTGVPRTDPENYWHSCFQDIVAAKRPVGLVELNKLFAKRLESEKSPPTGGHEQWFRHICDQLLQLFGAANLQIAPGALYSYALCSFWKERREAVLEKLTKCVNNNPDGLEEHDAERALLAAIEFIQSSSPYWPRLGDHDVVAFHCFTRQIVTKERFSTEWARTR